VDGPEPVRRKIKEIVPEYSYPVSYPPKNESVRNVEIVSVPNGLLQLGD